MLTKKIYSLRVQLFFFEKYENHGKKLKENRLDFGKRKMKKSNSYQSDAT